jgi:hypothetical protein
MQLPLLGSLAVLLPSRVVMGSGEGGYASAVFRLRNELISRLGISADAPNNLVMYVRAGTYGRLTPLVVDLPHSRQTLVITAEVPGERS